jgi:F420-non-reducing hydrogenase iron-sulfur subunit
MTDEFNPKIVGFLCNWCSYAGADLCGVSRYQYPPSLRVVRVMCSTRISPKMIIRVLREGADGVLIGGCHLGDCHYISGNYFTEKRFDIAAKLISLTGLETDRIRLEWVSASEGEKFSKVVTEFTEKIRQLGPTPVKTNAEIALRLEAAELAAESFRLTAITSKEYPLNVKGNVYGEKLDAEKLRKLAHLTAEEEFERAMILTLAKRNRMSVKELASKMKVPSDRVLEHIVTLRQQNLIAMDPVEGFTPTYHTLSLGGE